MWKETLWYNGLRSAGAGLTIGFLLFFGSGQSHFAAMFGFPITYFIFLLPVGLLAALLANVPILGWLGLVAFFFGLLVALGDPWVFLLKRVAPQAVPMERPSLFSPKLIQFVLVPFKE